MAPSRDILVAAMAAAMAAVSYSAWVAPKLVLGPTSTHTCVLTAAGEVQCWGDNDEGQLGIEKGFIGLGGGEGFYGNTHLEPVDLGSTAIAVACGYRHTCAVLDTGKVKCWGHNEYGQLGYGDTEARGKRTWYGNLPDIELGSSSPAVNVWAGTHHTCALLEDHKVYCWGRNHKGQVGIDGDTAFGDQADEMGSKLTPLLLGAGGLVSDMALGESHSCALFDSGIMKCWGENTNGNLGYGDVEDRGVLGNTMDEHLPAIVLGAGRTALKISAGKHSTCALLDDHSVSCWGLNDMGQAGRGSNEDTNGHEDMQSVPFVSGSALPTDIKSGRDHNCVVFDDNTLKCWGGNSMGQLGTGDTAGRGADLQSMDPWPKVDLGPGAQALQVGCADYRTCVLLTDGHVKCFGRNWDDGAKGRLGIGKTDATWGSGPNQMGADLPTVMTMVLTSTTTTVTTTTVTTGTVTTTTVTTGTATHTTTFTDTTGTVTATHTTTTNTDTGTTTVVTSTATEEQAGLISHTQPLGRSLAAPLVVVSLSVGFPFLM